MISTAIVPPASTTEIGSGRSDEYAASTTSSNVPEKRNDLATALTSSIEPNTQRPRYRPNTVPATSWARTTSGTSGTRRHHAMPSEPRRRTEQTIERARPRGRVDDGLNSPTPSRATRDSSQKTSHSVVSPASVTRRFWKMAGKPARESAQILVELRPVTAVLRPNHPICRAPVRSERRCRRPRGLRSAGYTGRLSTRLATSSVTGRASEGTSRSAGRYACWRCTGGSK